jgi:hypothetical protein
MRRRTPTFGPRAIDPISGFEVPHSELVKQWDGDYVARRFADARQPQDYVRARPERIVVRNPRPEPPERAAALPILWENGSVMTRESGPAMLDEGVILEL